MSEELDLTIEVVEEHDQENCEEEACESCGEVHNAVDLEKTLKRQKRLYQAMTAAYFISLVACGVCAYHLMGVWGAAGFAAGFAVYFFHLNMTAMIRILMTLEQASAQFNSMDVGAMIEAARRGTGDVNAPGDDDARHHGNYA